MGDADNASLIVPVPADRVVIDPDAIRWGTVSTIRAPLRDVARFAAHHLDLGAARVTIYLDEPDPETTEFLNAFDGVEVIPCDDVYWASAGKRPGPHQLRQAFNATQCYRHSDLDWMAHIDGDEFLLTTDPIARLLAFAPADAAFLRLRPAELLAQPDPWAGPSHFKLTRKTAGQPKSVLSDIYPEFGAYVRDGFFSYTGGKIIARTGLGKLRFGIHAVLKGGHRVTNGVTVENAFIGHAHAPTWDIFERYLTFRREKGSYRKKDRKSMTMEDVIDVTEEAGGRRALRGMYEELNTATPQLLAALKSHGMLLTAPLDLDEKVARWFGSLPGGNTQ